MYLHHGQGYENICMFMSICVYTPVFKYVGDRDARGGGAGGEAERDISAGLGCLGPALIFPLENWSSKGRFLLGRIRASLEKTR